MDDTTQKQCTICLEWKPRTPQFFEPAKGNKDGLRNQCKICRQAYKKAFYSQARVCTTCHKEKSPDCFHEGATCCKLCSKSRAQDRWYHTFTKYHLIQRPLPFFRICAGCGIEKPLDEFAKDPQKSFGRKEYCQVCMNKKVLEYMHTERGREQQSLYRQDPQVAERRKQSMREWQKANPEKVRESATRHHALKKSATIEVVSYTYILERDGFWCHICEQAILPCSQIDFDHVIPLSRGGPHVAENIKVSHSTCNRRKHDRLMEELTAFDRRGVNPT